MYSSLYLFAAFIIFICSGSCYSSCRQCQKSGPQTSARIIGYYYRSKSGWLSIESINAGSLTHLVWNGFSITNGVCTIANPQTDLLQSFGSNSLGSDNMAPYRGQLYQLHLLKLKYPHLNILVTISGDFQTTDLVAGTLSNFTASCVSLARQYSFDGIELNWLLGTNGGKETYAQLLASFREQSSKLIVVSQIRGPLSTMYGRYDFSLIAANVHWVHLAGFNMWQSSLRPGHHSPLYWSRYSPSYDTIHSWIRYLLKNGLAPCQIVLGLSLSGPAWSLQKSVSPTSPNVFPAIFNQSEATMYNGMFLGGYQLRYRDIVSPDYHYTEVFDELSQTSGHLNSQTFASVEGITGLEIKAKYLSQLNLGGVYLHDLSADSNPIATVTPAVFSIISSLMPCRNITISFHSNSTSAVPKQNSCMSCLSIPSITGPRSSAKVVAYLNLENIEQLDGNLFTHAIFDQLNWTSIFTNQRLSMIDLGLMPILAFKSKFPHIVILLQVGNRINFQQVIGNNATRMSLVSATIANVNYFGFHGCSIYWDDLSGDISNKMLLSTFLRQLRLRLTTSSVLTMELKFRTESFDVRYNLTLVDSLIDWYHVHPFDFGLQVAIPFKYFSWYLPDVGVGFFDKCSVVSTIHRILIEPISHCKIILVLPMFGFQLSSDPMKTWSYLAWYYPERFRSSVISSSNIIRAVHSGNWIRNSDPDTNVTLLFDQSRSSFIMYDGIDDILAKTETIRSFGLAGVGFYDVSLNDTRIASAIGSLQKCEKISTNPSSEHINYNPSTKSPLGRNLAHSVLTCSEVHIKQSVRWDIADYPVTLKSVFADPSKLVSVQWHSPQIDLSSEHFVVNSPTDLDLVLTSRSLLRHYAGHQILLFLNISCLDVGWLNPITVMIPTSIVIPIPAPKPDGLVVEPNSGQALVTLFDLRIAGVYPQSACARYFANFNHVNLPLAHGNCIPINSSLKTVLPSGSNGTDVVINAELVMNEIVSEEQASVTVQVHVPDISLEEIKAVLSAPSTIAFCDRALSTISVISQFAPELTPVRETIIDEIRRQYMEESACSLCNFQDLAFITATSELLKASKFVNNHISQSAMEIISFAMNDSAVFYSSSFRERIVLSLSSLLQSQFNSTFFDTGSVRALIDRFGLNYLASLSGGEHDACSRSITTDTFSIQTYKVHSLVPNSTRSCTVMLPMDVIASFRGRAVGVVSTVYQLDSGLPMTTNLVHSVNAFVDNEPITVSYASSPFIINMGSVPSGVTVECGWIMPNRDHVSKSGCVTDLSSTGMVSCRCSHLTDFVLIITGGDNTIFAKTGSPEDDALSWILPLASMLNVGLSILSFILGCFGKSVITNAESYKTFSIMAVLIVVKCITRALFYGTILFAIYRPNVDLFIMRLMFGTITQFLQFMIFGYLLCFLIIILASIVTMSKTPLRVRHCLMAFQSIIKILILSSLLVPILLIYGSVRFNSQEMFFAASAYMLLLNILLTLSIPTTGHLIARYLVHHSQKNGVSTTFDVKRYLRLAKFMRIITVAMGICLSIQAGLWTWAIAGSGSYQNCNIGNLFFVILDTVSVSLVIAYQGNVAWTQYNKRKREQSMMENNAAAHFRDHAVRVDQELFFFPSNGVQEYSVWDNVFDEFANGLGSGRRSSTESSYSSDHSSRPW